MRHRIKYPKTNDAVRAYKEYAEHHFSPCSFETWINVDDGITPTGSTSERKDDKTKTNDGASEKPQASLCGPFASYAGLGLLYTAKIIVEGDPWLPAKSMQNSTSSEVREYGYRIELAIEKERQAKKAANGATNGVENTK